MKVFIGSFMAKLLIFLAKINLKSTCVFNIFQPSISNLENEINNL